MNTFDAGLKTGLGVGHDAVLLMGCVDDDDLRNRGAGKTWLWYVPASWHKKNVK